MSRVNTLPLSHFEAPSTVDGTDAVVCGGWIASLVWKEVEEVALPVLNFFGGLRRRGRDFD